MNTDRFDGLTKALATGASRRRLVKRAAGSALAGVLGVVGIRGVGATHKEQHRCTPSDNHSCEPDGVASCPDLRVWCFKRPVDIANCNMVNREQLRIGQCASAWPPGCYIDACDPRQYKNACDACNRHFPTECEGKCHASTCCGPQPRGRNGCRPEC